MSHIHQCQFLYLSFQVNDKCFYFIKNTSFYISTQFFSYIAVHCLDHVLSLIKNLKLLPLAFWFISFANEIAVYGKTPFYTKLPPLCLGAKTLDTVHHIPYHS